MQLDSFLSPGPAKILLELEKRGGVALKSELLSKGGSVRWATYILYEKGFVRAGLIKITEEKVFPFKQTIELTEKGWELVAHLRAIQKLIKEPHE